MSSQPTSPDPARDARYLHDYRKLLQALASEIVFLESRATLYRTLNGHSSRPLARPYSRAASNLRFKFARNRKFLRHVFGTTDPLQIHRAALLAATPGPHDPSPANWDEVSDTPEWCERCGNLGTLNCYCGGDFCACENQGEIPCPECSDW